MAVTIFCGPCHITFEEQQYYKHYCKDKVVNIRNGVVTLSEKESRLRSEHWQKVKHWRPGCHCTRYCMGLRYWEQGIVSTTELRKSIGIDSVGDPVLRPKGVKPKIYLPSQGLTRPHHCTKSATSHPGYVKNRGVLIISFILKSGLHRVELARSVLKRWRTK